MTIINNITCLIKYFTELLLRNCNFDFIEFWDSYFQFVDIIPMLCVNFQLNKIVHIYTMTYTTQIQLCLYINNVSYCRNCFDSLNLVIQY